MKNQVAKFSLHPLSFIIILLAFLGGVAGCDSDSGGGSSNQKNDKTDMPAYQRTTWTATGGPLGGLGYDIRMNPENPDIMYVTDDGAGAFKSVDGGKSWFTINNGIDSTGPAGDIYRVFCLTIDPNKPDTIWLGTSGDGKIYRSDDAGADWQLKNNGIVHSHETLRGFAVQQNNSDIVYAATEVPSFDWLGYEKNGKVFDLTKGAVYKTIDGGENWQRIWYGDHLCRYIWIDPTNHDRIFVSTGIFDREAANSDKERDDPGGVGILRSEDGGQTWTVLNESNGFDSADLYIGTLYMHPENPDILLAGADAGAYNTTPENPSGGLYRTDNGGETWVKLISGPINSVEISESNPLIAYACSNLFYKSTDGGKTWTDPGEDDLWGPAGITVGIPIDIQCDPRDPNRLFVNSYGGGNFLSSDGGKTWINSSKGYTGARIADVAVSPMDASVVYASGRPGIFKSTNGGELWNGIGFGYAGGLEKGGVTVDPGDPLHLILCPDAPGKPVETFDGGQSWTMMNLDAETFAADIFIPKIIISPRDSHKMFALTASSFACWKGLEAFTCDAIQPGGGLLISDDKGATWSRTNITSGSVTSMAIPRGSGEPIYASVCNKGIYRSDDEGKAWELVYDASEEVRKNSIFWRTIAVDSSDSNYLYAGDTLGGIYISADGGRTWTASSAGMPPETSINCIVADSTNAGEAYACSTNAGVYYTTDSGLTWKVLNNGLNIKSVTRLALSDSGQTLYAGTEGGGVFRLGPSAEAP